MLSFGMPGRRRSTRAVRHDRLDAEDLAAHRAVTQHVDPTGVGRDQAADRRRIARPEVHADVPSGRTGTLLCDGQCHARAERDLARLHVHLADLVETRRTEHDVAAAWHRAAHQPRVPALRDDGDPRIGAQAQDRGDLLGRPGPHHRQRRPVETARPIGLVGGAEVGIGQGVLVANDAAKGGEEGVIGHARMLAGHAACARRGPCMVASSKEAPTMTNETPERQGGAWIGQHPDENTEKVRENLPPTPSAWPSRTTNLATLARFGRVAAGPPRGRSGRG